MYWMGSSQVEKGLRQGCTLSPLLYSIYVMGIVEKLEEGSQGVKEDEERCGLYICGWYHVVG